MGPTDQQAFAGQDEAGARVLHSDRKSPDPNAGRRPRRGPHIGLLLVVGTLWGLQPALIKALTAEGLPEIAALGLTLACISIVLGAGLAARRRLLWPTRQTVAFMTINAVLEYAGPLLVAFLVAPHVDAGLLTLIMSTTPVFTVALAAAIGAQHLEAATVLACAIGLLAMALIVVPEGALPNPEMLPWCLAAFSIPVFYALGSIYVSRAWPDGMDAIQVAFTGASMAGVFLAPFWLGHITEAGSLFTSAASAWILAAFVVCMLLEMVLYFDLLKNAGPVFTSFSSFIMIASGFISGAVVFGERPSIWIWGSVALFALSLTLILKSPGKTPSHGHGPP